MQALWSMAVAVVCAAALMPLVIRLRALDHDHYSAPQNVHTEPTSRLGGTVLFAGYGIGLGLAFALGHPARRLLALTTLSALPVFAAGVFEDVTRRLSPSMRLLAALLSAVMATWLAEGIIARLDLPYVDEWLKIGVLVMPLTWFMAIGACNALNLIDGAHGLSSGTALLMFSGMAVAAQHVGDPLVLVQALTMVGALVGFLAWNYPRGRVFLGDGGAYFVGFIYAELSIQIVARNPHISAWFVIMLAAYPIMETLYSIYRRKLVHKTASMQPDARHLHSLVHRQLVARAGPAAAAANRDGINALVAPRLWAHAAMCLVIALAFHDSTPALIACVALYAAAYCWHYAAVQKSLAGPPWLDTAMLREQSDGPAD